MLSNPVKLALEISLTGIKYLHSALQRVLDKEERLDDYGKRRLKVHLAAVKAIEMNLVEMQEQILQIYPEDKI